MKTKPLLVAAQAALIVLAGWWIYAPALHGTWLWDDGSRISENPRVQDPAGLWQIAFTPVAADDFRLTEAMDWLQWQLWGDHTFGFHVTNVALHLVSAFLIWRLFTRLGLREAWLGALLFVIHPLLVESVAWVSELKNTLSLVPLLVALNLFVEFDRTRRPRDYLALLFCFLVALLAKSSVAMFPGVMLLYAWWKRDRLTRRDLLPAAPCLLLSALLGLGAAAHQASTRLWEGDSFALGGVASRIAGAGLDLGFYFGRFFLPLDPLPNYPRWTIDPPTAAQFLPWLAMAVAFCWLWRRRAGWGRHVLFGLGFFVINLLPVLGFAKGSYFQIAWVADHFAYLAMIGLIGLVTAAMGDLTDRFQLFSRPLYAVAAGAILLWLMVQSHAYAQQYRDTMTLWTYTIARNPGTFMGQTVVGNELLAHGEAADAIPHYRIALRFEPNFPMARNFLGVALAKTGHPEEAIAEFRETIRRAPLEPVAYRSLGLALADADRVEEALPYLRQAAELDPDSAAPHVDLSRFQVQLHHVAEGVAEARTAVNLEPDNGKTHAALGYALVYAGKEDEAIREYREALRLMPNDAETHNRLGYLLARAQQWPEAIAEFQTALKLQPDYPEALLNLRQAQAAASP